MKKKIKTQRDGSKVNFIETNELSEYAKTGKILNSEKHKKAVETLNRLMKDDPEGLKRFLES